MQILNFLNAKRFPIIGSVQKKIAACCFVQDEPFTVKIKNKNVFPSFNNIQQTYADILAELH